MSSLGSSGAGDGDEDGGTIAGLLCAFERRWPGILVLDLGIFGLGFGLGITALALGIFAGDLGLSSGLVVCLRFAWGVGGGIGRGLGGAESISLSLSV
ncbi:hypothetical protein HAV15_006428 [Penicillium sp. str. |nr:hypothetical protein HAV15_006428 [Penicillium sp. str. \